MIEYGTALSGEGEKLPLPHTCEQKANKRKIKEHQINIQETVSSMSKKLYKI